MNALIDGDLKKRKGKGANKYTAYTFVSDTHKRCSSCETIKLHSEFHKDKGNIHGKGLAYYCKECANSKAREWSSKYSHTDEYKQAKRDAYVKNRHGLTLQEYEEKLVAQDSKCAICDIALLPYGHGTHLDHNHKTGQLRDFLCTNCNRGLGHFQDSKEFLEKASGYLETHNSNVDAEKVGTTL